MKKTVQFLSAALFTFLLFHRHMHSVEAFDKKSLEITDQLLNSDVVNVETMNQAYEAFKKIYDQLEFKDLDDDESTGSSKEEVDQLLDIDIESNSFAVADNVEIIYYTYESDEVFEELDDAPKHADLSFIFGDNQLVGFSIFTHSFYLDIYDSGYTWEEIQDYLDDEALLDDMEIYKESILSYAYVLNGGTDYHAVNVFTIDEEEEQYIENFFFYEDMLVNSYYYELDDRLFIETNLLPLIETLQEDFWTNYQESPKDQYLGVKESILDQGVFYDKAMELALVDYNYIIENYELVDMNTFTGGTTKEEFLSTFQTVAEFEEIEGLDGAEVIQYLYNDSAALNVYFVDDVFVYVGAESLNVKIDEFEFLSAKDFGNISLGKVKDSIVEDSLPILAFGVMNFDNNPIQSIALAVDQFSDVYEGHLLMGYGEVLDKNLVIHQSANDLSIHDKMILMVRDYFMAE